MASTPRDWRRCSESLRRLGEVYVVAPATEQSGVGHSITYLTPLIVKEVFHDERYPGQEGQRWGWAVQGSPADCVKIGVGRVLSRAAASWSSAASIAA